jgi:lysine 2,3-aminomutase
MSKGLQPAFDNFQMRLTPNVLSTIKEVGDPMWQQYVPTVQELDYRRRRDRLARRRRRLPGPEHHASVSRPRALSGQSQSAPAYCRFCTRRRKVGRPEKIPLNQFESAFQYLASTRNPRRDHVGRRPDDALRPAARVLFQRLREIPHIEIIRLGSRITSHLPSRITPEFCEMVKKYHPIYMNTHFNHPAELTP